MSISSWDFSLHTLLQELVEYLDAPLWPSFLFVSCELFAWASPVLVLSSIASMVLQGGHLASVAGEGNVGAGVNRCMAFERLTSSGAMLRLESIRIELAGKPDISVLGNFCAAFFSCHCPQA